MPSRASVAHRRDHARAGEQTLCVEQGQDAHSRHLLRSVEQRQALLGRQPEWLQAAPAECLGAVDHLAIYLGPAAAEQRSSEVRQRGQVARCADGALLGHLRVDAHTQEVEQPLDEQRPAAALPAGQRIGAQQQHRPDGDPVVRRSNADGVADDEVLLQPLGVGRLDAPRGQVAEAGGDAVDRLAAPDQVFDRLAAGCHPLARSPIECRLGPVEGNAGDILERQVESGQSDGIHCSEDRPPLNPR